MLVKGMDSKDVAIGFTLVVGVALGLWSNVWYSIVVDLLLLSSYSFIKHMFTLYKTEGNYINRVGMKPAYGLLGIGVLSFGVLRILYLYSNVFSSRSIYNALPWLIKVIFYTDIFFLLIFFYLLLKFTFVDFFEFSLPHPAERIEEFKEEKSVVEVREEEEGEREEKEIKEERGIKKLPVIIVSRG